MSTVLPRLRLALARLLITPGRRHDERGAAAVWTLIIASTAFVALLGLVGGGGELVNDHVAAKRAAEQAARAGADELSQAAVVHDSTDRVNVGDAIARAKQVLQQAGWSGTVQVNGSEVTVTATGTREPQFLRLLGVGVVHIQETGSANAISTPNG
jgi:Flp pilus assembly protein TadG